MKNNVTNEQFMEWVEQFLNDTITPESASQLLDAVQHDSEKMNRFCEQLQINELLYVQHQAAAPSTMAEAVLQQIKQKAEPKIIKPFRWNKALLRVAAMLAVVMGIGYLTRPHLDGSVSDLESSTIDAPTPSASPINVPKMPLKKLTMKVEKPSKPKSSAKITAVADKESLAEIQFRGQAASELKDLSMPEINGVVAKTASKGKERNLSFGRSVRVGYDAGSYGYGLMPEAPANSESYAKIEDNGWMNTMDKPLSTFSIDVDTAAYANVRRFLNQGQLPPADAVRVEEMINYFEYRYAAPGNEAPFSTAMNLHACPWNANHQLLRVGLQGRQIDADSAKPSNLVFLFDVSGSMNSPDKLPLLKKGFTMLVNALGKKDRVAIVVYAGSSGLVLDSTSAANKETIVAAMNRLQAGGSTAGGAGIELAYRVAADHYIKGGVNRVVLATDGDFNVGVSNRDDLQKLIEQKRATGIFLSVLGFGSGNLKDSTMELLANKGNGNYFYIDSEREADKVLVKQLNANMVTIAKDVKIQIEFNPASIRSYRLIGYENRVLAAKDFNDDRKDAGEIGAGHQVTALYELVPVGAPVMQDGVPLKYTKTAEHTIGNSDEILTLKLRYKKPEGSVSKLLVFPLKGFFESSAMDQSFRWATAVAAFGQYLRQSEHTSHYSLGEIKKLAESAVGDDPYGYRREFIQLIELTDQLKGATSTENGYPQWQYRN